VLAVSSSAATKALRRLCILVGLDGGLRELSRATGLSRSTLHRTVTRTAATRASTFERIARALRCSADDVRTILGVEQDGGAS
jgi:DNA-binding Xre family transcriptional regulator